MKGLIIRDANINDIPFIVETIVEAEKSGTNIFSYNTIFGLSAEEAKKYIENMLLEEVDDCELSISSFKIAVLNNIIVGATAAWIEGFQGLSSTMLKGNLLNYTLPMECIEKAKLFSPILKDVHIEHTNNSIQLGLVYVKKKYRGMGLVSLLIDSHTGFLKQKRKEITEVYVQVFSNNLAAIKAYKKVGFSIVKLKKSSNKIILKLLPFNEKTLMLRELK
ncbi:MAG: hypothetical protein ACI8ZX_000122 [Planctomycetota bacterium]|jgi:hypothetical protein